MKKVIHSKILNYFLGLASMMVLYRTFDRLFIRRCLSDVSLLETQRALLLDSRTVMVFCLIFVWTGSFIMINGKTFSWKPGYSIFFMLLLWSWGMQNEPFSSFESSFYLFMQQSPVNENWYNNYKVFFTCYGLIISRLISFKIKWDQDWKNSQLLSLKQGESTEVVPQLMGDEQSRWCMVKTKFRE